MQIDPSDYEVILLQRKSGLLQASADFELELGRQDLAQKDYKKLEGTISSGQPGPKVSFARARYTA